MLNISTPLLGDNSLCTTITFASLFLNSEHSFCHEISGNLKLSISLLESCSLHLRVKPAPFHMYLCELELEQFVKECCCPGPCYWEEIVILSSSSRKENKATDLTPERIRDRCHDGNRVCRHSRSKRFERYLLKGSIFFRTNDLFSLDLNVSISIKLPEAND